MTNLQKRAAKSQEQRARRMANRIGLVARKSRCGIGSVDNHGGFMLVDQLLNSVEAGDRFDLSADDVIKHCTAV